MLLHKTCSSPGSMAGKFKISFFKMKTFLLSHIQPLCLFLSLSFSLPLPLFSFSVGSYIRAS